MPSGLATNPTPEMVTDFLEKTANQLSSIQFNMISLGDDLLERRIKEAASDVGSDVGTFSRRLGELFAFWAEYIQGQELQLRLLFPNIVREREAQRVELVGQVQALTARLSAAEAAVPSNDSVLMEHITGIAAKVSSLADQWHKGQGHPPPANGIFASIHAPSSDERPAGGKGKKHPATPAIFGEEQPAKRQASVTEAQRVQDPYAIPRDWDWEKISAISSLMKVCKGRIPPESALAIANTFEFRLKGTPAHPTPVPQGSYAAAAAAPAASAGPPSGSPASPAKPHASAQAKVKAPVVHVPAPKDHTKLLRVVFSSAIANLAHRRSEPDVREWARETLARYGEEANEVCGLHWHEGGVHVDIRFQTRPTVAARDYLSQGLDWLANTQGSSRSATIDFYTPITRLAVRALRTHNAATQQELSAEGIIAAIKQENPWIAECVLTHIQSPKPFWIDPRGGSGTFVFAAYDNRNSSVSAGWCKRKLRVLGVDHTLCRHDITVRIPLCDKCWHWQHSGSTCKGGKLFCAKCSLPHLEADHPRYCVHADCQRTRLETLEARTSCDHVYCANCDSTKHAPSSRECPYSKHAGERDGKQWFDKNPPKFSAHDILKRGRTYDGKTAVDVEKRRRLSGDGPADDVAMGA
ncbi:hypothetical protein BC835DRAFT_1422241 [Cytidiella melzeri]|nr:hypothetical protein BC835DRAFT_1422241 [Cytidiella melzeri]